MLSNKLGDLFVNEPDTKGMEPGRQTLRLLTIIHRLFVIKAMLSTSEYEHIQDLFDCARYGELEELQAELARLSLQTAASIIDENGNTLLHMAAANGHLHIATHLLSTLNPTDIFAFVRAKNSAGNTALHWAALNKHLEVVTELLKTGAEVGAENEAGHTAIYEAEQRGHEDVVRELVMQMELQQHDNYESRATDEPDTDQ